jgi:hypothetical protein
MPIEVIQLANAHPMAFTCPKCGAFAYPFMRGQVQRSPFKWWQLWGKPRPYCAVICSECKDIVGWESP